MAISKENTNILFGNLFPQIPFKLLKLCSLTVNEERLFIESPWCEKLALLNIDEDLVGKKIDTDNLQEFWDTIIQTTRFKQTQGVEAFRQKTIDLIQGEYNHKKAVGDVGEFIFGNAKQRGAVERIVDQYSAEDKVESEDQLDFDKRAYTLSYDLKKLGASVAILSDDLEIIAKSGVLVTIAYFFERNGLSWVGKKHQRRFDYSRINSKIDDALAEILDALAQFLGAAEAIDFSKELTKEDPLSEQASHFIAKLATIWENNPDLPYCIYSRILSLISSVKATLEKPESIASFVIGLNLKKLESSSKSKFKELREGLSLLRGYRTKHSYPEQTRIGGQAFLILTDKISVEEAFGMKYKEFSELEQGKKEQLIENYKLDNSAKIFKNSDEVIDYFNIRGSVVGASLSEKQSIELIKRSASSFFDLSDVLGVSGDLSLSGYMALSLAARGRGGKGAAIAHYEPLAKVVNLTNRGGMDGSLAHEMGHAMQTMLYKKILEDQDLYEIYVKFRKRLFGGKLEVFMANRAVQLAHLNKEKVHYTDKYSAFMAKARQEKEEFHKEKIEPKELLINLRRETTPLLQNIRNFSKIYDEHIDDDKALEILDSYKELLDELESLKQQSRLIYNLAAYRAEPTRLLANEFSKQEFDIKKIIFGIENNRSLKHMSKLYAVKFMPKEVLEADNVIIPSETLWEAACVGSLESGKKVHYWASENEMFARSFETYVKRALNKTGRENTFLVHPSYPDYDKFNPYPAKSDSQEVDELMSELIEALKAKGYVG